MPKFRYTMTGKWFKGNTHIHSTASDGGKTFPELAQLYSAAGYDFLFRTDHWVASNVSADPLDYPLLWLDGVELDGADSTGANYHVVALGTFQGIMPGMKLQQGMESARHQGGLLILAHPFWTGNSFEDAMRWPFDGVEVYNHVCRWLNGKGYGAPYWGAMLDHAPNTLAFASDDAHINPGDPGPNGGWVMVNAAECTPAAILSALRAGNFYSSTGPRFESIEYDGKQVSIRCSPVCMARIIGPDWHGDRAGIFDGAPITQAAFEVPLDWPYARLELEDEQGRLAWTNTLFLSEP